MLNRPVLLHLLCCVVELPCIVLCCRLFHDTRDKKRTIQTLIISQSPYLALLSPYLSLSLPLPLCRRGANEPIQPNTKHSTFPRPQTPRRALSAVIRLQVLLGASDTHTLSAAGDTARLITLPALDLAGRCACGTASCPLCLTPIYLPACSPGRSLPVSAFT